MGRKHGAKRKRATAKQPSRRRSNRLASLARDRGNGGTANTDANTDTDYEQTTAGRS